MRYPKAVKFIKQETDWWLPGAGGRKRGVAV